MLWAICLLHQSGLPGVEIPSSRPFSSVTQEFTVVALVPSRLRASDSNSGQRSMNIRALLTVLLAVIGTSCEASGPMASRGHPYGLWSTERGQTIEVRRNGTFRFCDERKCELGKYEPSGRAAVLLVGFSTMIVTERLRKRSGLEAGGTLA